MSLCTSSVCGAAANDGIAAFALRRNFALKPNTDTSASMKGVTKSHASSSFSKGSRWLAGRGPSDSPRRSPQSTEDFTRQLADGPNTSPVMAQAQPRLGFDSFREGRIASQAPIAEGLGGKRGTTCHQYS